MRVGRLVGRALLVTLDALAAGFLTGLLGSLAVPVLYVGDAVIVAVTVGGVGTGVTLAASLALVGLGRRPFPATRLAKAAFDRLPWWI
ncbi:hypothetical protein ACKVMT_08410 [Halobacteriales archaeon Cl-PHB]